MTKSQQAIRDLVKALRDLTGNLPPLPGIFPDHPAPIVRNWAMGRELAMARGECRHRRSSSRAGSPIPA